MDNKNNPMMAAYNKAIEYVVEQTKKGHTPQSIIVHPNNTDGGAWVVTIKGKYGEYFESFEYSGISPCPVCGSMVGVAIFTRRNEELRYVVCMDGNCCYNLDIMAKTHEQAIKAHNAVAKTLTNIKKEDYYE